jgi:hypothetical protein
VLGWFELSEEDRPPKNIWLDDEGLEEHFERVNNRYRDKSGSTSVETVPDIDEQNEVTRGLKKGRR